MALRDRAGGPHRAREVDREMVPMKKGISAVYVIRNRHTGRAYVGGTVCVAGRFWKHRETLRKGTHYNKAFQAEWSRDGEPSFAFEVMEPATRDTVTAKEQRHLDALFPTALLYNIGICAEASARGLKRSEETKRRQSAANKGQIPWILGRRQEKCKRGHALTPENRIQSGSCRRCTQVRGLAYYYRKKAKRCASNI